MTAWKAAAADALDAKAAAIETALAELDNVHAVLEADRLDELAGELRGFAAGLRACRASMQSEARALRATGASNGAGNGMPMTTRFPRARPPAAVQSTEEDTDD